MPSANTNTNQSNLGPKIAAQVHELYTLFKPVWVQLSHVREGTGGFLSTGNDSYIVPHPREWLDHTSTTTDAVTGVKTTTTNPNPKSPSPKLKARRKLARYENVASSILESKKSLLFRESPTRRVGKDDGKKTGEKKPPTPLEAWWEDVDGEGTHIDDALPDWWDLAATFGHVVLYMDVAPTDDAVTTAADQPHPYVRPYTPLDVLDWRVNESGRIIWIKLLEAYQTAPQGLATEAIYITRYRIRIVDEQKWTVYDKGGKAEATGDHNFGCVPVVVLFGKRRAILTQIGESVLGDPRNYIDLFNLTSEIRELLRAQTFSFINVPLGTGPDAMSVENAQAMMGQQTGAMNVIFSGAAAQILTGDSANITSYHEEIARVKREIYRETGIQWEADTKGVEAKGSLELKREEMTVRVSAYADECQQAEYGLVDLFYRCTFGADVAASKQEADEITIHYPERFAQTPFKDVLDEAMSAQQLGMPAIFLKELRKGLATKFEGMANLPQSTMQKILDAIDQAPDDPTPAERMQQKMKLAAAAVVGGGKPPAGNFDAGAAA